MVQLDREITSFLTDADTRALDKFREVFTFGPELDLCPLISDCPTG